MSNKWHNIADRNKLMWQDALDSMSEPPVEKRRFAELADADFSVVMVEFREHEWLRPTLWNVAHVYGGLLSVGREYKVALTIVCGTSNVGLVRSIVDGWTGVEIRCLPRTNCTIEEYNGILTSTSFYDLFRPCPVILVIQTDTLSRKRIPKSLVEKYSYVGAPWWGPQNHGPPDAVVGNGGYSLRDVESCRRVCESMTFSTAEDMNEDLFFAKYLRLSDKESPQESKRKTLAPADVARAFSVEQVPHDDPSGMHQAWRFHLPAMVKKWLAGVPGTNPSLNLSDGIMVPEGLCP